MLMINLHNSKSKGQSILEALFALSLSLVAIGTVTVIFISTQVSVRQSIESNQATWLAKEGLAATQSIGGQSFSDLSPGAHGIALVNDEWVFSGTSDARSPFTRTVFLTEVNPDQYEIESTVTWAATPGKTNTVTLTSQVSNWQQTTGIAASIQSDVSGVEYTALGTVLQGLELTNSHASQTATINTITLDWDGGGGVSSVFMSGVPVFVAATSGPAVAGQVIDVIDTNLLPGGSTLTFGPVAFTVPVEPSEVLLTLNFTDDSRRYIRLRP